MLCVNGSTKCRSINAVLLKGHPIGKQPDVNKPSECRISLITPGRMTQSTVITAMIALYRE